MMMVDKSAHHNFTMVEQYIGDGAAQCESFDKNGNEKKVREYINLPTKVKGPLYLLIIISIYKALLRNIL